MFETRKPRTRSRNAAVACAALCAGLLLGCAPLGPTVEDATETVTRFAEAISAGDGADACAYLNDHAVEAVEEQTGLACADGVLALGLPTSAAVVSADVYGRSALVVTASDHVFLAVVAGAWQVRAAGCAEHEDAPFDCAVDGS